MATAKRVMLVGLDGSDPNLIRKYIAEGKLPNIKRFLERGASTPECAMQGALPTITPPNWATQATGAWPNTHGITCFWNHTSGNALDQFDYGFNSELLEAETIWEAFSRSGKKSILFNYPTAWPPRKDGNIYVDGTSIYTNLRGYIDYEKVVEVKTGLTKPVVTFHELDNTGENCRVEGDVSSVTAGLSKEGASGSGSEYEGFGYTQPDLVTSEEDGELSADVPNSDYILQALEAGPGGLFVAPLPLNYGLDERYVILRPGAGGVYDTVEINAARDGSKLLGKAREDGWSDWIFDTYTKRKSAVRVAYKIRVLSLDPRGASAKFYLSFVLDLDNGKYFSPPELGAELYKAVGPMLQPVNYDRLNPQADAVAVESLAQMYEWHAKAIAWLLDRNEWDLFYVHMHGVDMYNHFYLDLTYPDSSPEYRRYQEQIYKSYEITDRFVGALMDKYLDDQTAIVLTSDHAGVGKHPHREIPLIGDSWGISVGIMGKLGYTALKSENGKPVIDWSRTRAISQRTSYIYVNLKGRDPQGIVEPEDYDALVAKIIDDLYSYRDSETGKRVIAFALNKRDMELVGLGGKHCGDIFFILEPEFTRCHGNGLSNHELLGYSLKSFFALAGAGVKRGVTLKRRVRAVDLVPTLCHLAGAKMPQDVEGGVIYQALLEE